MLRTLIIAVFLSNVAAAQNNEHSTIERIDYFSSENILKFADHLFETGANDVMVVQGERQHLIPFTRDAVLEVDLEHGLIRVDWDPAF